eukprot:scaffold6852_cov134-Isochrysis_galbana.AAC.1
MSFTDERLTREQFADVKSQLRFGQVPCLTVNGDEYFQSSAILRYIGRAFDSSGSLYPSGNLAVAATIDALLDACTDMVTFRQAQGVSLHTTESPPPPLLSPSVHTSLLPLSPPSTIRGSLHLPGTLRLSGGGLHSAGAGVDPGQVDPRDPASPPRLLRALPGPISDGVGGGHARAQRCRRPPRFGPAQRHHAHRAAATSAGRSGGARLLAAGRGGIQTG